MKILFKRLKLHKLTELTHCSSDNEAHFREDCPLSKPSLQGLEHAGHVVQLLAGELLRVVDDVIVHLESEKKIISQCSSELTAIITFTLDGNGMSFNTSASYFAWIGE